MNQDPSLENSRIDRMRQLRQQAGARMRDYRSWFAEQPLPYLGATMLLGPAVLAVLYAAVRFVNWVLAGLVDWLFIADAAPPPPPPAPAPGPEPTKPLAVATDQVADHIGDLVLGWSQQHPVGAADPVMMPVLWLIAGALLLVCSRSVIGVPLFAAWSVATVATVYTATAAGNPVPAALTAAAIALLWCAWWAVAGFVKGLLS